MKISYLFIFFTVFSFYNSWSQSDSQSIVYTHHFTVLLQSAGLEIHTDSLDQYLLTDKTNPYLRGTDLYLVNPQEDKQYIVVIDEKSRFPQIKFSSHVTNLMDNENEHQVAFYSLDEYFILTELHADWAVDAQFMVKDQEDITGYARSFYNAESGIQVTVIILARELPLLSTPSELSAIRFKE